MTTTKPTRLGELTAYDLGSTITFHDGGATYTGSLLSVKHEFPDGKRRTFVMLLSESGKWRHADRYPSNLPIDEIKPAVVRHDPTPAATGGRAIGGPDDGPGTGGGTVVNSINVVGAIAGISPIELARRVALGQSIADGRRA